MMLLSVLIPLIIVGIVFAVTFVYCTIQEISKIQKEMKKNGKN